MYLVGFTFSFSFMFNWYVFHNQEVKMLKEWLVKRKLQKVRKYRELIKKYKNIIKTLRLWIKEEEKGINNLLNEINER